MKPTGFFEILVMVVTLVAGLPLFIACVTMANRDMGLTYLDDKSTWAMEPDYVVVSRDTDGDGDIDSHILMPEGFTPLNISIEQGAMMAYVQDEYGVPSARSMYYKWDMDDFEEAIVGYTQTENPSAANYNWYIPYRQRAARVGVSSATQSAAAIAHKSTIISDTAKDYYMVWNSTINAWVLTEIPINTIGVER